ncbi:aldo/keto reductase [Anaerocolumna sp. AGMB13020]|uniref:aldo/keto reductase n=1 Tax=Anaerocolumna sp. AGMB13020 TaxID=3081750 RepID=UPI0029539AFC|nr:aldo/keto reductase [Anaerocolumna sp. AGMB13020]WOO35221.1 aldo/keto reductase [Anaerocolumna sp. AGMB13020]
MNKLFLKGSELQVSELCLGTAAYGGELPAEAARDQLDCFYEAGGNFIDTAHIYNDWIPGEKSRSEKVIGSWLKDRGLRNQMILATKGGHPDFASMDKGRLTPAELRKDMEESLACLRTEVIDLYILHRDDIIHPVGEILEYLEEQVKKGYIRYYGFSNWKKERLEAALEYGESHKLKGFVTNQLMWSMAKVNEEKVADKTLVTMDRDTYQFHREKNLSAMAYMSMAKGYFTKRILDKALSEEQELMYANDINDRRFRILKEAGVSALEVTAYTLKFILAAPFSAVPIASFSSLSQLEEAVKGLELKISEDLLKALINCEY